MTIKDIQTVYARSPQVSALAKILEKNREKQVFLEGLLASSTPLFFAGLAKKTNQVLLFVLQDVDEAGYFYHDLTQIMGETDVLYFPSSYRRAIKYAQKDPASEISRTEALTRFNAHISSSLYVVTYPEALAEMVVTRKKLDDRTLSLEQGQSFRVEDITAKLIDFGFREVDYVYEPGQFALRGSILDVFSFSHEFPYRLDFFGDEIDSIRTFEVENQLSRERINRVDIVPEMQGEEEKESFFRFLPQQTVLVFKDYLYARDAIDCIYQKGFSSQAKQERLESATEMERQEIEREMRRENQIITGVQFMNDSEPFRRIEFGHRPSQMPKAVLKFNVSAQPLFHKNFDLLINSFEDYLLKGYQLYILADSQKQNERLKDIFAEKAKDVQFTPVDRTLHDGFADNDLRICLFTDHQIFDRFHKYNLKSDKARGGKVALTLKEIQQFEIGDYVVHVDHGIGKFGGLVRMPIPSANGESQGAFQEMIKIQYQHGDAIYVSIHSLYKVSKYKSQENGEPPRMSFLGTGQW